MRAAEPPLPAGVEVTVTEALAAIEQRQLSQPQLLQIIAAAEQLAVPLTAGHAGSLWGFFFTPGPVRNFADARRADTALFARFHRAARQRGVLLPPSAFEACFVSAAHTDEIIAQTLERLADALAHAVRG